MVENEKKRKKKLKCPRMNCREGGRREKRKKEGLQVKE